MTRLAINLEHVLTGKGFADVPASPLQLAIVRAAEGHPIRDAIGPEALRRHFGCDELPSCKPRRVVIVAGIRGGKSLMSACAAINACLTADLSSLKPHEVPRYAIIGPTVDAAHATFVQLTGIIQGSKVLRAFLHGEPTADTVVIRRPDGRKVEIVVVAAHRGGLSVRNRWLVGCTLEEVASFGSEATGAAVSAEEILRAAETRLLPGCQAWLISSPFGPVGLLHDLHQRHFAKPSASTLVVHAPTRALNPSFPQSRIDEIAAESPDVAAREYGAEWVDADSAFLSAKLIDAATRVAPVIRVGRALSAAMDPATRGNDWTLSVAWTQREYTNGTEHPSSRVIVGGVWRWQGSKKTPLSPRAVLAEVSSILRPFGIYSIHTDQWSIDALNDHARAFGLALVQNEAGESVYHSLKTALGNGLIELPPDTLLRSDLISIRTRATSGGTKIHLPRTADGRHCDFAPSVALAVHQALERGRTSHWVGGYEAAPDERHGSPLKQDSLREGEMPPSFDEMNQPTNGRWSWL